MTIISLCIGILATSSLRVTAAFGSQWASPAVVEYLTCVTYGMLGALTFRVVLLPSTDLAETGWMVRLLVPLASLVAYGWFKWRVLHSLGFALAVFLLLIWIE